MRPRAAAGLLLAALLPLLLPPPTGAEVIADGILDVGYSERMFAQIPANDALAAIRVWLDHFMATIGRAERSRTGVYNSIDEAVQAVQDSRFDLLVMPVTEFLEVRRRVALVPTLVASIEGQVGDVYALLSRADVAVEQLRGEEVLVAANYAEDLPVLWLHSLRAIHDKPVTGWFDRVRLVERSSAAVLPVFFGDARACVVTLGAFETMRELNPQLGTELQIQARSSPMPPVIICLRPEIQRDFGDILDRGMRTLHEDPKGRQVLALFGIDSLMPFREIYLDVVRGLVAARAGASSPAPIAESE